MHKTGSNILFICILLVMLVGMSAVSAENNNTISHADKQVQNTDSITVNNNTHKTIENTYKKNIKNQNINTYYVSCNGTSGNDGTTSSKAVDIETGFNKLTGNTNSKMIINQGTYKINKTVNINKTGNYQIIGNGEVIFNTSTRTLNIERGTVSISNITFINSNIKEDGGAIKNNGTLTVNNDTFNDNTAFYQKGGAIYNTGNLTVINSTFNHNTAQYGGAIYNNQGHMTLENNIFNSNTIQNSQSGGAIYNNNAETNTAIIIKNNYFTNNTCDFNGGGVLFNNGSAIFTDNYVEKSYGLHGGAIYNLENITITDNIFNNNTSGNGPVIYSWGTATLNNNTMINNRATTKGGAIYNMEDMILIGNNITNNTAPNGGAIYNALGTVNMTNNTITDNNAAQTGGAIYNQATINMNNNTLINNKADNGSAIYNTHHVIQHINPSGAGSFTMRFHGNITLENNIIINHTGNTIDNTGEIRLNNNKITGNEIVVLNNNTDEDSEESGLLIITNNQFNNNQVIIVNYANATFINNTYTSCNLETTTNTILKNETLNNTNYKTTINIKTKNPIYNTTINNGKITITINNKQYREYKVENGQTTITIPKKDFSQTNNNITYTYTSPDKSYQTLTLTNMITIIKHETTITTDKIEDIQLNNTITITGTLEDTNKTDIPNATITIKINSKTYNTTTDSKGKFKLQNIQLNQIGTNNITLQYNGDNNYNKTTKHTTVNVTKIKTNIITTNKTETIGNTITIKTIIKDTNNNIITKGKMAVKINGKTFGYTQIHNGTATYTLKLDPKKFSAKKYTITIKYGGSSTYTQIAANTTLIIIKHNSKFNYKTTTLVKGETARIIVKITDDKNTVKADNGTVGLKINGKTYKINGKAYTVKPVNGTAAFIINTGNLQKNNNITFTYSGYREFTGLKQTYNNGLKLNNQKTIITTNTTKAIIGENAVLRAKFTGADGQALTSGRVAVKINGKTFGHAQIRNGIATYTLKLDPKKFSARNYTVTFKYGGSSTYTQIAANTTLQITKHTTKFNYTTTTAHRNTTARITLKITDNKNTVKADNGTLGLKINGKTYKENGKAVIIKPVNGTATFNIPTHDLKTNNNITFTYSGYREFDGLKQTYNNGLIIRT